MNQQYLEYVRGAVSLALADIHGMTKGQLAAFESAALAHTTRFKRQRHRTVVVGNRKVCPETDPIHCPETRTRVRPFPPLHELTYCTSSWRRAVSVLDTPQHAWIRYCYAHDLNFDGQVAICRYVWADFLSGMQGKKMTGKVLKRIESLVWLAVQQRASEYGSLQGCGIYQYAKLAELTGVQRSNWQMHYAEHWECILQLVTALDANALHCVVGHRIARKQLLTA